MAMVRNTGSVLLIGLWLIAAAIGPIAISASSAMAAAAMQQKTFATPAAAVDALIAANRANKMRELLALLGPEGAKLIHSGDPVADKGGRERFLAAYDEAHKLELDGQDKAILIVGKEGVAPSDPVGSPRGRLALRHHGGRGRDSQPADRPQRTQCH